MGRKKKLNKLPTTSISVSIKLRESLEERKPRAKTMDQFLMQVFCEWSSFNDLKIAAEYWETQCIDAWKSLKEGIIEIFLIVESYVFRRAICDIPAQSFNKTFANMISEVNKDKYLESVKAAFIRKETYRRFPNDLEFTAQFTIKNVYDFKIRKYVLDKLENFGRKELVNVENYTLEHIMPQNKNLSEEWKKDLGSNWMETHDKYLHTIGNLTLTGYNPELSNKSFLEKRNMKGGFADSPIRLNDSIASLKHWNEKEILKRASSLAEKALKIWKYPDLPQEVLEKYKVEEDTEEEFEDDEMLQPMWDELLENASQEVQQSINSLINTVNKKFDCVVEKHGKYLHLYVAKPTERKSMFAFLSCGKTTANVMFRINPKSFKDDDDRVRYVTGWFFPRDTERQISIKQEDIAQIMRYLRHAYTTTNDLMFKQTQSTEKAQSITRISRPNENVEVIRGEVTYTEDSHLRRCDDKTKAIYNDIKSRIMKLSPAITLKVRKKYIAFANNDRNFVYLSAKRSALELHLRLKKGELKDPKKLATDISNKAHFHGLTQYILEIDNKSDLRYATSLITQAIDKTRASSE